MASSRVRRGRETERAVADYLATHGWPCAKRRPASLPGSDVENVPGLAIEVKARRALDLPAWIRQAKTQPGLPIVIHRPDGFGLTTVGDWPATLPFSQLVRLLREAGYGDPYCE
jgi:hypothetical protein